jgi:hypothetical protein
VSTYEQFESDRIKHLEFIQAVVTRLGNNSFLMKGWALTVAGAFFGFAVNNQDRWLAVASVLPTVTFWGLDTYFLRCERLFRMLYKRVSDGNDEVAPFFMDATSPTYIKGLSQKDRKEISWWRTLRRPTLLLFYGAILASAAVIFAIAVTTNSNTRCG